MVYAAPVFEIIRTANINLRAAYRVGDWLNRATLFDQVFNGIFFKGFAALMGVKIEVHSFVLPVVRRPPAYLRSANRVDGNAFWKEMGLRIHLIRKAEGKEESEKF